MPLTTSSLSVADAEAQLEAARVAEKERVEAEARAARIHERSIRDLERSAKGEVEAVERLVADALSRKPGDVIVPRGLRGLARAWLYGGPIQAGDLQSGEGLIAGADPVAEALWSAVGVASAALARLGDPLEDLFLPGDHPLIRRLDAAECKAWAAFVARVRQLAGEG